MHGCMALHGSDRLLAAGSSEDLLILDLSFSDFQQDQYSRIFSLAGSSNSASAVLFMKAPAGIWRPASVNSYYSPSLDLDQAGTVQ